MTNQRFSSGIMATCCIPWDEQGRFARYKMVDPSFHNWIGLALALLATL